MQVANKLLAGQGMAAYNPYIATLRDENIITTATTISNTFFYNRANVNWGIDYNFLHTNTKQLLTYGVEGNSQAYHTVKLRWNLNKLFTYNTTARRGVRAYQSALSDGRTYDIGISSIQPSLTWMYRSVLRITASVQYEDRKNDINYGGEHSTNSRTELDFRYSKPVSGVIALRGSYANITYNGIANTSVAYNMLDALLPGANWQWFATWERRVSSGIEVSFEYEGRKSTTNKAIHTGRMTIKALL
jgi:hypothetical protein